MEVSAFIIHNPEVPESVAMATRALASCVAQGVSAQMTPGVRKSDAPAIAKELGLTLGLDYVETNLVRPMRPGQIGAFLAHRQLWEKCKELKQPIIILEHDVELTGPLVLPEFKHVLNLQRYVWDDPSWPYHQKLQVLADPTSTNGNAKYKCMPGVCAYAITPQAARMLLSIKKMIPVDLFINKKVVTIDDHDGGFIVHNEFSTVRPGSVEF